jgi:hypothetical protein
VDVEMLPGRVRSTSKVSLRWRRLSDHDPHELGPGAHDFDAPSLVTLSNFNRNHYCAGTKTRW